MPDAHKTISDALHAGYGSGFQDFDDFGYLGFGINMSGTPEYEEEMEL